MNRQNKTENVAKLISIILSGIIIFFLAGHISAIANEHVSVANLFSCIWEHIKNTPFDLPHFNKTVFIYAAGIWLVGSIGIICSANVPKADMKGIEKGSNDFMDEKELKAFLKKNTTRCR